MLRTLFIVFFLALAGCQQLQKVGLAPMPVIVPPPVPPPRADLPRDSMMKKYSLHQLSGAETLLKLRAAAKIVEPEGEGDLGCRIDAEEAKVSLGAVELMIDDKVKEEKTKYELNPLEYSRDEGFDKCSPRCLCGTLASVLKSVSPQEIKAPKIRSLHVTSLKRLRAKSARQSDEESRLCAENQSWYCASDLRDYARTSKDSTAPSSTH